MLDHFLDTFVRLPAAVAISVLPRRLWRRFDDPVRAERLATVSGALTFLAGSSVGIPAYFGFLEGIGTLYGLAAPVMFVLTTPLGALSGYLVVSGVFRAAASLADDAQGDPLLTLIDRIVTRRRLAAAAARQRLAREALEGPDVPDRLLEGASAGFPDADWVVVSSRRKTDWTKGTFVVTGDKWYRLHEPVERTLPVGLRTFYPMSEVKDLEARRRWVEYELPPVTPSKLPTRGPS